MRIPATVVLAIVVAGWLPGCHGRAPDRTGDCHASVNKIAELQLEYLPPDVRREELKLVQPEIDDAIDRCKALGLDKSKEQCIGSASTFEELLECDGRRFAERPSDIPNPG